MDKFTYTTTYKQEFCIGHPQPRPIQSFEDSYVGCKPKYIPGTAVGANFYLNPLEKCQCQAGGMMPPRGAIASGLPTNLSKKCICFTRGNHSQPSTIKTPIQTDQKIIEKEEVKDTQFCGYRPEYLRTIPTPAKKLKTIPDSTCPPFKGIRPIARGHYGGQYEGTLNLPWRKH